MLMKEQATLASTSGIFNRLRKIAQRIAGIGLLCLMAAALLPACDDDPPPEATSLPTMTTLSVPTSPPTSTPTATPAPTPTPEGIPRLAPTATAPPFPTVAPMPEPTPTATPAPTSAPTAIPTPTATAPPLPTVAHTPEPTPTATPPYTRKRQNIAAQDNILVGAHYYPWYSSKTHWDEGRTDTPVRGDYDSRDRVTINQHIDEATGFGIDFFNMSWWGPGSWEDKTLRDHFLDADLIDEISFSVFYETLGRLKHTTNSSTGALTVDLSDPANRATLIADFKYLAQEYFDHPSYLKIDGKPVVMIYLTRTFSGDIPGAVSELRSELRDLEHELFMVADEVYWKDPNTPQLIERIAPYDAVFAYNMHYSNPTVSDHFIERSLQMYHRWQSAAAEAGVDFIPAAMPGFDATKITHPNPYIIKRSPEKFAQFIQGSLTLLGEHRLLLVTSFNEWHEGTQIEPSEEFGYSMLQALAEVVNASSVATSPTVTSQAIETDAATVSLAVSALLSKLEWYISVELENHRRKLPRNTQI